MSWDKEDSKLGRGFSQQLLRGSSFCVAKAELAGSKEA